MNAAAKLTATFMSPGGCRDFRGGGKNRSKIVRSIRRAEGRMWNSWAGNDDRKCALHQKNVPTPRGDATPNQHIPDPRFYRSTTTNKQAAGAIFTVCPVSHTHTPKSSHPYNKNTPMQTSSRRVPVGRRQKEIEEGSNCCVSKTCI